MAKEEARFEDQLNQLQEIVTRLQQGNVPLEESIQLFQTGMQLSTALKKQLDGAEATLAKMMDAAGQLRPAEKAGEDRANNGGGNQGYQSPFADEQ